MLPLPKIHTRREDQREGRACVWCGHRKVPLKSLGHRLSSEHGLLVEWAPKGCAVCTRIQADRVFRIHMGGSCARCAGGDYCPDARALYSLLRPPASAPGQARPTAR